MEGNAATDALVTESESVRRHVDNMILGRKIFREANASLIIKKALKIASLATMTLFLKKGRKSFSEMREESLRVQPQSDTWKED